MYRLGQANRHIGYVLVPATTKNINAAYLPQSDMNVMPGFSSSVAFQNALDHENQNTTSEVVILVTKCGK